MAINKRFNTSKKDIVKSIILNTGIPTSFSEKIFNNIITIIINSFKIEKRIKIKNFGNFKLQSKKMRKGRNPKNKKEHDIAERFVVTFIASDYLKRKVNENDKKK